MKKAALAFLLAIVMVVTTGCFSTLLMDDTKEHSGGADVEATTEESTETVNQDEVLVQNESEEEISSQKTTSTESPKKESSKTSSKASSKTSSKSKSTAKKFNKYILSNYKGMTVKEVIKIWGNDYTLANEIYRGGWAYIYYDEICFYYEANTIPTKVNKNAKLAAVGVYPGTVSKDVYLVNNIKVSAPYSKVSQKLQGEFWEDQMDGGYSYTGSIKNMGFYINWQNVNTIPSEICLYFTS